MKDIDDTPATAAYLTRPARTLEQWRYLDCGPAYIKVGGQIRYRKADVDEWLAANTVRPSGSAA